jgi:hypothetical protein
MVDIKRLRKFVGLSILALLGLLWLTSACTPQLHVEQQIPNMLDETQNFTADRMSETPDSNDIPGLKQTALLTPIPKVVTTTQVKTPAFLGEDSVDLARNDLAKRLEISSDAIELVSRRADEFPAGDLGCPAAGETPLPMPAFVFGQTIVLEVGDIHYIYHTSGSKVAFCGQE